MTKGAPVKILMISDKLPLITQVKGAIENDYKFDVSLNLLQKELISKVEWKMVLVRSLGTIPSELDNETLIILDYDRDRATAEGLLSGVQHLQGFYDLPILLLGSPANEAQMKAALSAGASAYLLTPLNNAALLVQMSELLRPVGAVQKIDVQLINPFINATANILQTAAQMNVTRKRLFLKKNYRMLGDISGVMGLTGHASGAVVISLPARMACSVVGKMLGEAPPAEINDNVRDGVGELVNMVAGHAKAALAESKYHFVLSLPVVVTGRGHEIAHKSGSPCIVVVFEEGGEELAIQVSLSPEDKN
jgi:chemotaxis protein CheX